MLCLIGRTYRIVWPANAAKLVCNYSRLFKTPSAGLLGMASEDLDYLAHVQLKASFCVETRRFCTAVKDAIRRFVIGLCRRYLGHVITS
jgi:hypothetical protein